MRQLQRLLAMVGGLPPVSVYLLVGAGTAVENIFPPVPSDTFVLLGAVLAQRQVVDPLLVGAVAWASNVGSALLVYGMARRYGRSIFRTRWGQWLLRPHQLERLAVFYGRYGLAAIFGSRFLPVFRVLVPAFAGIAGLGFWATALPLAIASAAWYGALLWIGMFAARNLGRLVELVSSVNEGLLVVAGLLAVSVAIWWWRTRRQREQEEAEEEGREGAEGEASPPEEPEAPEELGWWPERER